MNPELEAWKDIARMFEDARGPWLERARAVAREIAKKRGTVSADDLRNLMREHPELAPEGTKNVMGGLFRSRDFVWVGWRHSRTPGSHGNRIGVYALADQEAAA